MSNSRNADEIPEFTTRDATVADYEAVMNIDKGLFGGFDYLPDRFHRYVQDTSRTLHLCIIDGQVVGLKMARLVDDRQTYIGQGARLSAKYRSQGLWRHFRAVGADAPLVADRMVVATANRNFIRRFRQRDVVTKFILSRASFEINYEEQMAAMSNVIDTREVRSVRRLPKTEAHAVLSDKDNVWRLFPHNRIILNYEPFRANIASNLPLILSDADECYWTPACDAPFPSCTALSLAVALQVNKGLRYAVDYYGSDVMDAAAHAYHHACAMQNYHKHGGQYFIMYIPATIDMQHMRKLLQESFHFKLEDRSILCNIVEMNIQLHDAKL